jgi:2-dehydropantoate 2-reductase
MKMQSTRSSPMKILSFGAGAIGTYIGGSLALAGHHVTFIEKPPVISELQAKGLRLDLGHDKRRQNNAALMIQPASFAITSSLEKALLDGPFDLGLFALKSYDTGTALASMIPFVGKIPPLLCLSNGVDNEPAIAGVLGSSMVISGAVTTAIVRRGPGDIVLERLRGIGIGAGHPLSERIVADLDSAFLNGRLYADAAAMKWSKMLTNLVANPTSAILDMTAAEIFADPCLYSLEIAMLRECLEVMKAMGIEVVDLPSTPVRALALAARLPLWISKPFLSKAVGSGRGGKMPSFHIDLHSGRGRSEVEFLHGAVVREGRKLGIQTPVNRILTETLIALTNKDLAIEEFARQPKKLLSRVNAC